MWPAVLQIIVVAFCFALLAFPLLVFLVFVYQILRDWRVLLDPRVLRRLIRFRLRTLLVFFAIVQIVLGVVLWRLEAGESAFSTCVCLGCLAGLLWFVLACFEDSLRATASRRWKSRVRPRRISGPPPKAGERS
jgi:hypothetical protein